MTKVSAALPICALLVACGGPSAPQPPVKADAPAGLVYPSAKRIDHVDDYHGTKVADPYRWLEDSHSDETKAWVSAQQKLTTPYLQALPARAKLTERLTQLWNYEKHGVPYKEGGRYFTTKNDGLQNHYVHYWSESLDAEPKVLFDPNTWSEDGTVSLGGVSVSPDGKRAAYAIRDAGSDWRTWKVRDIDTGKDLADELKWVKFSSTSWTADSKGFYYARFPAPEKGKGLTAANRNHRIYYHRVGEPQSADRLIFETANNPKWLLGANVTDDGRFLIIGGYGDKTRNNLLWVQDLTVPDAKPTPLISTFEAKYSVVDNDGPLLWVHTNLDAPRSRLIAIDTRKPQKEHWKEVIPQSEDTLLAVDVVADTFIVDYLHNAHTKIRRFGLDGKPLGELTLPGIGSAGGFAGKRKDTETFYNFTSFTEPQTVYRYDLSKDQSTLYRKPKVDFDGSAYTAKQVFFTSKDGTKIPMFIVHKKGLALDGSNPTLLRGYGGFNSIENPYFSITNALLLELGAVFALPNLRGGGEFGEEWHRAGTKLRKQNVFDDFIAAAEYLIAQGYTRADRLAIEGGSNGGLLVGAVMTQRPELFGVALPHVGVMDMRRFHTFTIGHHWVDDYGSSDDPDEFKALYAYSPYHNLEKGTCYPATLVLTADHDDRVVPGHSFKFAAELQHAQGCDKPTLIRIQSRAGHGAGTPTAIKIEKRVDVFAFMFDAFGIEL